TVKGVTLDQLRSLEISLPPIPEQRRIAAILDKADALHAKRRKTIAKLKQLERSVFYGMFGEQEVEIQRWPVVTLDSLASLITKGTTPTTLGFPFVATGTPLLRVQNLSDLQVHLDDVLFIDPATNE